MYKREALKLLYQFRIKLVKSNKKIVNIAGELVNQLKQLLSHFGG